MKQNVDQSSQLLSLGDIDLIVEVSRHLLWFLMMKGDFLSFELVYEIKFLIGKLSHLFRTRMATWDRDLFVCFGSMSQVAIQVTLSLSQYGDR